MAKAKHTPRNFYWAFTPAGTPIAYLESYSEEKCWRKLEKELARANMPYRNRDEIKARGYEVCEMETVE